MLETYYSDGMVSGREEGHSNFFKVNAETKKFIKKAEDEDWVQ